MDFFQIAVKERKQGGYEAYPDFVVGRSEDLMVRGKNFYAIYDDAANLWSTDEYKVQELVDAELRAYQETNKDVVSVKWMRSFGSNGQSTFRKFMSQIGDNSHQLDETLTFLGTRVNKKDFVSKRLPYDLAPGDITAWDKLISTLYAPEQREKIEWYFGSIISGASKTLQKFIVLYGPPGAGKGTILDIAMKMFQGYVTTFDAKALGSNGNQFAAAAFGNNPLVAIQHDGDLSRIDDNTLLNSIVSHEMLKLNEKYKPAYDARINAALMMGTNKPVKITDAQSGLIRRLIDIHPTGNKLPPAEYHRLIAQIDFELGAVAHHCLQVFKAKGKNYYSNYQPLEMMFKTNAFFNFIEAHYDIFEKQNGVSAKQAWEMFKTYRDEIETGTKMTFYAFKSELGQYFEEFHDRYTLDGILIRSYYTGFKGEPFKQPTDDDPKTFELRMDDTTSLLNLELADWPAQYAKADGTPSKYWDDSERIIGGKLRRPRPSQIVDTHLKDLDPYQEHYVKIPDNMIVIDFDLRGEDGAKSLSRNLEAAALWPATYGELSTSGAGVHLHYYYDGDVERLDPDYSDGIEVKVYRGNAALRRRLTRCLDVSIATINSGLPLKENVRVIDPGTMKSEKALRDLIARNLRKEIHPGTKPSVDFIKKILDDAYSDGLKFDVSDLYQKIVNFANSSTNKPLECLRIVQTMRFKSQEEIPEKVEEPTETREVLYDVEVYPNLFIICWKFKEKPGVKPDPDKVTRMINPKPHQVQALMKFKLVGFNNRSYDNHIMWGAAMGFNNEQLYQLSQKIINNVVGAKFGEAYKISWTDIYDFSTDKKGLKKWQIQLGLEHREMDIPFEEPVPEDRVMDVVEYCVNDVVSTESVMDYLWGDYQARLILADLAGMSPNETTANLTAGIVFGKEKNPQKSFVYTKLDKEFPGYVFELGKSTYRDEQVGEGGYVYSEPGLYRDVALLDVASMHPTSIGQLNLFGEYTPRYMALVEAQLAIKRGDLSAAKELLGGKLRPYIEAIEALEDPAAAKKAAADLRWGLKIAMNIVYGLTSAKFDNPFKDRRNIDNIVAKRGALFMIDLKHYIQSLGYTVAHIKTDSVKIPNATQEIIDAVINFSAKYGYVMEYDPEKEQYSKLGLVNDAVYVAKKDQCNTNCWSATGTQYQHPYVFKKLFGNADDISILDLGETKNVVKGKLYLDFGQEGLGGHVDHALNEIKIAEKAVKVAEKLGDPELKDALTNKTDAVIAYHDALKKLIFVGKVGRFVPVKEGYGGGQLYRVLDGKHYAVAGTKGHLWVDANVALDLPGDAIDYQFFEDLVDDAWTNLEGFLGASDFSSVEEFLS